MLAVSVFAALQQPLPAPHPSQAGNPRACGEQEGAYCLMDACQISTLFVVEIISYWK